MKKIILFLFLTVTISVYGQTYTHTKGFYTDDPTKARIENLADAEDVFLHTDNNKIVGIFYKNVGYSDRLYRHTPLCNASIKSEDLAVQTFTDYYGDKVKIVFLWEYPKFFYYRTFTYNKNQWVMTYFETFNLKE